MVFPENDPRPAQPNEPLHTAARSELPPEMAAFLADAEAACLFHETDRGTALVAKLPRRDIDALRGAIPVAVRHELYEHPVAPVIRTVLTLYDQRDAPVALEAFINVADPEQRQDFAGLAHQDELLLLLYDEYLVHCLTKRIPHDRGDEVQGVLATADALAAAIADGERVFDRAKADVLAHTRL